MSACSYCHAPFYGSTLFCCHSCELLSVWSIEGTSPLHEKPQIESHWEKYGVASLEKTFNLSTCPVFKKFRFYIEGLQCASCVHLLEDFPQFYKGVLSTRVNYTERTMVVETESTITLAEIAQAIEKLGYKPTPLNESQQYVNALKNENRSALKRIGVAGAVAGNLMLFSIPLYAGLMGQLGNIFIGISLGLFFPLLFYCATPFYRKAWSGILSRQANVDMMIVVALWSGFLLSVFNLIQGLSEVYFDSTASFIFLILLTRYFLRSYHDRIPVHDLFKDLFSHEVYNVRLADSTIRQMSYEQLAPHQEINLNKNQIIPCDVILKSPEGTFDLSFLTGEPTPQIRHAEDIILAGSQVIQDQIRVVVKNHPQETELFKSLEQIDPRSHGQAKIKTISDKASHYLTLYVFAVAGLFFILSYPSLGIEAFKRCLALITIACPCAIAFGTPLVHSLGLKKALQNGFFIKSSIVFEKISQIKSIVFDKTGTLTSSQLQLIKTFPENLSYENKSIILGLEKTSQHPVALSLRKSWPHIQTKMLPDVQEIPSLGVSVDYNHNQYQLIKAQKNSQEDQVVQVDYLINGQRQAYFYFQEQIRVESSRVIEQLQKRNFEVMMLTGDQRSRAIEMAKQVGIRPAHVFADQSANSKKDFILQHNPCLYIGDGLNDLPALHQAWVSFAVKGVFESTFKVSDIYAPKKNLYAILEIIDLSHQVQRVLKYNLLFALFYNTAGGIMALLGFINPLVAALLMPLSSFIILIHSSQRMR